MKLFDTHCHIGLDGNDPTPPYERAVAAAVTDLVLVGVDRNSSRTARDRARQLAGVRWSAGLHPNSADDFADEWAELQKLAGEPDCCAIGETGLDFYRDRSSPENQQHALREQLQLARKLDLPIILHCRQAMPELLTTLAEYAPVCGVIHCFDGNSDQAERAVEMGLYISLAGPLTYKKNDVLRDAARAVPEERLLIETDAPFLTPQAVRGQPNEPAFLRHTLERLAAERGCDAEHMAAVTYRNALTLFGNRRQADDHGTRQA